MKETVLCMVLFWLIWSRINMLFDGNDTWTEGHR
jgi:hypothetical protein